MPPTYREACFRIGMYSWTKPVQVLSYGYGVPCFEKKSFTPKKIHAGVTYMLTIRLYSYSPNR